MKNSKNISRLKKIWREENYINKEEIINTDHNIIDQVSQFFASGSFYYYIFNFATLEIEYVSDGVTSVLELEPKDFTLEKMLACYHPEDIQRMQEKERLASDFLFKKIPVDQIIDYKVVYLNRIITKSGKTKTILHQAKAISVTEDGRLMKVIGVHTDITYLSTPIDHKVSFISFKYPSYYSQSTEKLGLKERNLYTKREVEIIELMSVGFSIQEISEQLFISEHTVKTHRKNILRKVEVKNTVHLIAKCIREGVI